MIKTIYFRKYGDHKIKKPKELKGIKKCKSAKLRGRNCDLYIKNNDIWIYFGDFLSEEFGFPELEDASLPASALASKYGFNKKKNNKFIYPDAWVNFLARNEAWVCLRKKASDIKRMRVNEVNLYVYYLIEYIRNLPINKAMGDNCRLNAAVTRVLEELMIYVKCNTEMDNRDRYLSRIIT